MSENRIRIFKALAKVAIIAVIIFVLFNVLMWFLFKPITIEAARLSCPNNMLDAVYIQRDSGAMSVARYLVYIVEKGKQPGKSDKEIFAAKRAYDLRIKWEDDFKLLIQYEKADIYQFRNYLFPFDEDLNYEIRIEMEQDDINQISSNLNKKFDYDQAVQLVKKHVLAEELYEKLEDIRFSYEPNNDFWKGYCKDCPEMREAYSLTDKDYYAFIFSGKEAGSRGRDLIVFVDKDEGKIIGTLYGSDFVKGSQLNYDQAIKIMKQHVLALGLSEQEDDVKFTYEPNNSSWEFISSDSSGLLEECGLKDRNYYAFYLMDYEQGMMSSPGIVFVDRDEKRVIGTLYDRERFVRNTAE